MPKMFLIHGFNIKDQGQNTIVKLEPYIDKNLFDVEVFSYGWLGLMGVFYMNPRIVKQLLCKVNKGDIAICHSNGCLIAHMAARFGAPFESLMYIAPALNSNVPLGENVGKLTVLATENDNAVKMASWLRVLMPWAPLGDSLWGDMGARGYQPGRYIDSDFNPKGIVNKIIHYINVTCLKVPPLLFTLRIVCIPVAIFYWIVLGPLEALLTYYRNNVIGTDPEMALSLSRIEDRRFVISAFALPVFIWVIGAFSIFW